MLNVAVLCKINALQYGKYVSLSVFHFNVNHIFLIEMKHSDLFKKRHRYDADKNTEAAARELDEMAPQPPVSKHICTK